MPCAPPQLHTPLRGRDKHLATYTILAILPRGGRKEEFLPPVSQPTAQPMRERETVKIQRIRQLSLNNL